MGAAPCQWNQWCAKAVRADVPQTLPQKPLGRPNDVVDTATALLKCSTPSKRAVAWVARAELVAVGRQHGATQVLRFHPRPFQIQSTPLELVWQLMPDHGA